MERKASIFKLKKTKAEFAKSNTLKGELYDTDQKKMDFYLSSSESPSVGSSSDRSSTSVPQQAMQAKIMIKKLESCASELSSGKEGKRSKNEQTSQ